MTKQVIAHMVSVKSQFQAVCGQPLYPMVRRFPWASKLFCKYAAPCKRCSSALEGGLK